MLQDNSSVRDPPRQQLSRGRCRWGPLVGTKKEPRERRPTFAALRAAPCLRPPMGPRWWRGLRQKPCSKVPRPGSVLGVLCACLAGVVVIPAMGESSPADRQPLAPEMLPKNFCRHSPFYSTIQRSLFSWHGVIVG